MPVQAPPPVAATAVELPSAIPSAAPAPPTRTSVESTPPLPTVLVPPIGAEAANTAGGDPMLTAAVDLPRFDALPAAQRNQLPPLRISVHVFAEDAAQRFVVIDGRRQRQGDPLGGGARLTEIRRDGVVLEVDGKHWLLARP